MASFTVNSRPDIGTWSGGNAWINTSGSVVWAPNNTVASDRDVTYTIGYASDKDFAGDFALPTATTEFRQHPQHSEAAVDRGRR